MPNPIPAVKKFVATHKTPIIVVGVVLATATVCAVTTRTFTKFNKELLSDALDFIDSQKLEEAFIEFIIEK